MTRPGNPAPTIGPGTETSTGPVRPVHPVCPQSMSATKMFPRVFAVVSPAIVALVTVKWRSLMFGVDPPLHCRWIRAKDLGGESPGAVGHGSVIDWSIP